MHSVSKLPKTIIHVLLIVVLITTSCYDEEDYDLTSIEAFSKITVDRSENTIPADGNSNVTFTFKFPTDGDSNLTALRLIASNGTFLESKNDTLNVNFIETANTIKGEEDRKEAVATLVASTTPGESNVNVRVLNYEKDYTITFKEALPTSVSLSTNVDYIKNDTIKEINLIGRIRSSSGVASQGTTAYFFSNPPNSVGFLKNTEAESNSQGTVQTTFVFTDTSYKGDIKFTLKVDKEESENENDCQREGNPCHQDTVSVKVID